VTDTLVWWLTLEVLGLAAWPVAGTVMRRLPDRGWAFSKALGLLLVGYGAWLVGMLQLAPFGRFSNSAMLLGLAGGAAWLLWRNGRALGRELGRFLRDQARYWICAEVLFGLAFVAWAILRAYSPNIFGTEKFMDFAFLNSFTQGQSLPPHDPWLAGYSINYYYFGYTLMATLCHLSGVDSAIGFNLANVTLFSLTVLGSFGVAYNLVAGLLRARRSTVPTRVVAARAGAPVRGPAPIAVPALPVRRVVRAGGPAVVERDAAPAPALRNGASSPPPPGAPPGHNGAGGPAGATLRESEPADPPAPWSALLAGGLAGVLVAVAGNLAGADQVLNKHQTADTFNWWDPSRVVRDVGAPLGGETINEFPFFSFLLNDMHPHMLALPLVLLVLGLALGLLKAGALRPTDAAGARAQRRGLLGAGVENRLRLLVYALATGSLFVANTWDYPTYLLIVLLCLALPILGTPAARWAGLAGAPLRPGAPGGRAGRLWAWRDSRAGSFVTQAVGLVGLGLLLFLPFHLTFTSLVGGQAIQLPEQVTNIPVLGGLAGKLSGLLGVNIWPKTWIGFMTVFGVFLYAVVALVGVLLSRGVRAAWAGRRDRPALLGLLGVSGVSVLAALIFQFPLLAVLPPLLAAVGYLAWERLQPGRWSSEELFALVLIGTGGLITLGTEVFFLQDVFHSRFNTLFKFYYQAWVLWGLAAGFATWWLLAWAFGRRAVPGSVAGPVARAGVGLWAAGFAGLCGLALIYPALAPAVRDNGIVWVPGIQVANPQDHQLRGLDGITWMGAAAPDDLAAIRWIRANVHGNDGVAEAAFNYEYNMQGMHGRVSAYTGAPTIIAWPGHEQQWRGGQPAIAAQFGVRQAAQDELYATLDPARAQAILRQYGLRYVFVGTIETGTQGRQDTGPWQYSPAALAKFAGFMDPVFRAGGTTVEGDV